MRNLINQIPLTLIQQFLEVLKGTVHKGNGKFFNQANILGLCWPSKFTMNAKEGIIPNRYHQTMSKIILNFVVTVWTPIPSSPHTVNNIKDWRVLFR
jgi:hypothetical protein